MVRRRSQRQVASEEERETRKKERHCSPQWRSHDAGDDQRQPCGARQEGEDRPLGGYPLRRRPRRSRCFWYPVIVLSFGRLVLRSVDVVARFRFVMPLFRESLIFFVCLPRGNGDRCSNGLMPSVYLPSISCVPSMHLFLIHWLFLFGFFCCFLWQSVEGFHGSSIPVPSMPLIVPTNQFIASVPCPFYCASSFSMLMSFSGQVFIWICSVLIHICSVDFLWIRCLFIFSWRIMVF